MKLNPYLIFSGNAEEAINFYKNVLDGEIVSLSRYKDTPTEIGEDWKDKIIHARLSFDENVIMISDGHKKDNASFNESLQLSVEVEDENKLKNVFDKMAEGGKIKMALAKQFWGATFGMLQDKFGVDWMFNHEEKK